MNRSNPRGIYLEITDRCNLLCPMCITRNHRTPEKTAPRLTEEEILEKILIPGRELGLGNLVISGGEPLLSSSLLGTVRNAVGLGYNIYLATNLHQPSMERLGSVLELLNDSRHTIQISFDSVVPEEMAIIRGKDVHEELLKNCRELLALRDATNSGVGISGCIVLQESNLDSVINTVFFLLHRLRFHKIYIQPRHDYSSVTLENYRRQLFPRYEKPAFERLIDTSTTLFKMAEKDPRIRPSCRNLRDWIGFYTDPGRCTRRCESSKFVYINAYGNYRGCLFGNVSGTVRETGLGDYFASAGYQKHRKLQEVCSICVLTAS